MKKILLVEDDIAFAKMLQTFLERKNYEVSTVHNGDEAKTSLEAQSFDLLLTDLQLPDISGLELLDISRSISPKTQTLLMTGYADVVTAVEAIKKGAIDYISKPFRPEELVMIIEQASGRTMKKPMVEIPKTTTPSPDTTFVKGISEVSKKFANYLNLVGPTDMCVLIQGESGTGKEVAAKAIHDLSSRKQSAFIAVDCGAIPKEIASSEFFGHVKGSFTGAINDKIGHFEAADGGTLFLDEVGNLSYENQIQLLRALQERKIKPVGSNKEIKVDVRIISATNEDLLEAVAKGDFREDLYHRLNEFTIEIPSLHERKEDLFLFIEYFLHNANTSLKKNVLKLSPEVEKAFQNYRWPGNLRELKNVIKRSVLLTAGNSIPLEAIPREVVMRPSISEDKKDFSKDTNEKQLILDALKEAGYNKSKAAKLLQITRKTLYNKINYYDLKW